MMLKPTAFIVLISFLLRETKVSGYRKGYVESTCSSQLFCESRLLDLVQTNNLFGKSKIFVDMSSKTSNDEVIIQWERLMRDKSNAPTVSDAQSFVMANMINGSGLTQWEPKDYNANPWFMEHIRDENIKSLAQYAVSLWSTMGRKITSDIEEQKSSLLFVPNGFIIPSNSYSETYYWDSYWIVEGLLICEMDNTAKGMIENFIHLIKHHGFVPNGGRVYYTTRSQPPLLTFMVWRYLLKTRNFDWLTTVVQYLDHELQYWVQRKLITVEVDGLRYKMAMYNADSRGPRPEMYLEDFEAAKKVTNEDEKQELYNHIKAAAESGWDFSSRWMINSDNEFQNGIEFLRTKRIAPVDLNSFLYGAFMRLSSMFLILENFEKRTYWYNLAKEMKQSIQKVLWNEDDGVWYDFDVETKQQRRRFAASNLTPLWVGAYNSTNCMKGNQAFRAATYMVKMGINKYKGGIPATLENTGEKWDFPNAWPNLQSIIVQGLKRSRHRAARVLAEELAKNWVAANMKSWKSNGILFDYYNAENPGSLTDGRKYTETTGGWTNGVLLDFINTYYVKRIRSETVLVVA